jgi:S1-C subfamily serine protease
VAPASPAADVALQPDVDIIVAIDAIPIRTSGDLDIVLSTTQVGQTITLTLQRYGQLIEQPITLRARP